MLWEHGTCKEWWLFLGGMARLQRNEIAAQSLRINKNGLRCKCGPEHLLRGSIQRQSCCVTRAKCACAGQEDMTLLGCTEAGWGELSLQAPVGARERDQEKRHNRLPTSPQGSTKLCPIPSLFPSGNPTGYWSG